YQKRHTQSSGNPSKKRINYYPFGSLIPNRHGSSKPNGYRYGFNGKEDDWQIKGEGNSIGFEFREYDPRIGRFITIDPIANNYPWQSPYVFAANNPVTLIDVLGMGPGDPKEHQVKKGDNLTKISKKYGVSISDLVKMNKIKDKDKLSIDQTLIVNPEADFSNNPRGGYQNPDNPQGKEIKLDNIANVGFDFVTGSGEENSIIVGGDGLTSVKQWREVQKLLKSSIEELKADSKLTPGEVAYRSFRPGNLPENIKKGIKEAWDKIKNGENPWENNSQNSPIHVLGSFNMSVRVNANGTTATVCIYDSKTFKSLSDGNASEDNNKSRKDKKYKFLTNTYQRYLWNVNLSD
ncbi:RHS repeat domain-containing protein, partial [Flavobacterium oreochromis]